jgi:c-di-AMP phosphodiesterase-like protein
LILENLILCEEESINKQTDDPQDGGFFMDIKFKKLFPNTKAYMLLIAILISIIFFFHIYIGMACLAIYGLLVYYNIKNSKIRKNELNRFVEDLSTNLDVAGRNTLSKIPMPLVIVDSEGKILWGNSIFTGIAPKDVYGSSINTFIKDFNAQKVLEKGTNSFEKVSMGSDLYNVLVSSVEVGSDKQGRKYIHLLYFINKTDYYTMYEMYNEKRPIVSLIECDNYDDVVKSADDSQRPLIIAEIDKRINAFANSLEGFIRKYEDNKYILVFDNKYLNTLIDKRFDILDNIPYSPCLFNSVPCRANISLAAEYNETYE